MLTIETIEAKVKYINENLINSFFTGSRSFFPLLPEKPKVKIKKVESVDWGVKK